MRTLRLALVLLCAPTVLAAQQSPPRDSALAPPPLPTVDVQPRAKPGERFGRMVVPAVIGSGVGLVAGAYAGAGPFYEATGCCGGGDDPGLSSALWGGVIGATLGSTLGAYVTRSSDHPVSLSRAFVGSTVGIGAGLLVGFAGAGVDDARGLLVGFAIGQGMTTAGFAVPYPE
jgi:hypothetical protein